MLLVGICFAALGGIAAADLHPPNPPPLLLLACMASLAAWLARRLPLWRSLALLVCAAALGGARVGLAPGAASLGPANPVAGLAEGLAPVRAAAQSTIAAYLPEPQASLATGVLLGGSGHLDPEVRAELQRSGLGHLLAIDGFKQVVVTATVSGALARMVGPRLALLPTLGLVAAYTLVAGAHASAVRAALMVTLASLGRVIGRVADPLTSLGLVVLAMALADPRVLLDLGLQLSLSATLGIVLLWPALRRTLRLYRLPRPVAEPLGLTLAVSVACLPLTLAVFREVSLVSPLAHVLVVPLLPAVLFGTSLLAAAGGVPQLAAAVAWLAWLPTSLLLGLVHLFGSLPGAAVSTGRLSASAAVCLALVLVCLGVWCLPELRPTRRAFRLWRIAHAHAFGAPGLAAGCLGLAALLSGLRPDGQLHVDALALGRAQAVFIRGPTGRTALVALGGGSPAALLDQVSSHLAIWEHRVDQVVVFDAAAGDALGPTLARYPPDRLVHAAGRPSVVQLDIGGGAQLSVSASNGQLELRSAPTTSAATPESAD